MNPIGRSLLLGAAALMVALSPTSSRAEISAPPSPGSAQILQSIVDDPDPIDVCWRRYTASTHVLNEHGFEAGDGPVSLVVHPDGRAIAAWARHSGGFDVVVSVHDSSGWSDPIVLAGSADDELDPQLVIGPAGEVHVFYWVDGTDRRVVHRESAGDMSSWSDPVRVSQPGEPASRPGGTMHGAALYVAYEVHAFGFGATPKQIVLASLQGGSFVPEIVAISSYAGVSWPQAHSHGGVLWVDWQDSDVELAWTRRESSGTWSAFRYDGFADDVDREFHVRPGIRLEAIQP